MNKISDKDIKTQCFNDNDLERLLKLIASGKAILFAGAGFSAGATNIQNDDVPTGKLLADKIDEITGEESHQNLLVASQNAIDNNMSNELIELIKNIFTVKQTQPYHQTITALPWRRFYTTNYDFVIRDSGLQNDKRIKCVTTSDSPTEHLKEKNLCVHINGHLDCLNNETLNTSFKLTDSSYLHNDALNDSPWVDHFQKELSLASAIVFVGYSLYDYNIKSLLFNKKDKLKNKIYFITQEKPCEKIKTEQQYGKVINIGVKKFADYIFSHQSLVEEYSQTKDLSLESIKKYTISDELKDISHDMIRDFLIFGRYDKNYIDQAIQNSQNNKHLIIPDWIDKSIDLLTENNYVHITGDLGTGKSIGMQIVASKLANLAENVFIVHDRYGDFIRDIEKILEQYKQSVYILIDNIEQNYEVLQYIYSINSPIIHCVSFSRKGINKIIDNDIYSKTKLFSLDKMKESDVEQLIKIVENIGITGSYSTKGLKSFIEQNCDSSLPSFLLDILNSSQIAELIKKDFNELNSLSNGKYRDTIIALCLLGVLNRELSFSAVAILTGSSNIRDIILLEHNIFKNFFSIDGDSIESKSPIFLIYLLQNYYFDSIKKEVFLKFATISNYNKQKNNLNDKTLNLEFEKIFKELVKYVSLSKLFTKDNFDVLLNYFEQLKNELNWLDGDPNYWIQLAILNLTRKDFDTAKDMIKKARKKAENKREKYELDYIDTVEARYKLALALKSSTSIPECYDLFFEADDLLKNIEASDQKYRRVNQYIDIFKKINGSVSREKLKIFLDRIQFQLRRIIELENENYIGIERVYFVHNCEANLKKILQEANR